MNKYEELIKKHKDEIGTLPIQYASDSSQRQSALKALGTTEDEVCHVAGGGVIRKSEVMRLNEMVQRHDEEIENFKKDDDFLLDMFTFEMNKCHYTNSTNNKAIFDACKISMDNLADDKRIGRIFCRAVIAYYDDSNLQSFSS